MASTLDRIRKERSKSSGGGGGGGLFGWMPDLGVGSLVREAMGIVPGVASLVTSLAPGGQAAGDPWSRLGKSALSSFAGTGLRAIDAATLGQAHALTDPLREDWGNLLGGEEYRPATLSEAYNSRGLLSPLVEDVGNLAIIGAGASRAAGIGRIGTAAKARAAAAALEAPTVTARQVSQAAKWAKRAERVGVEGLDEAAVARRMRTIQRAERVAHPYERLFRGAVRPLTRAAHAEWANVRAPRRAEGSLVPGEMPTRRAGVVDAPEIEAGPRRPELEAAAREAAAVAPDIEATMQRAVRLEHSRRLAEAGEPTVHLFRGEGAMATEGGFFYSDSFEEALSHAGGDTSKVYRVEVPQSVAAAAQEAARTEGHFGAGGAGPYLLPDEWGHFRQAVSPELAESLLPGSTSARAAMAGSGSAGAPPTPPGAAVAVREPEAPAQPPARLEDAQTGAQGGYELPDGAPPRVGPHRLAEEGVQAEPPAQWAQDFVTRLPDMAVRFLAAGEDFFERRVTRRVFREYERFQEAARRWVLHQPAIQRSLDEAKDIVGQKLEDGRVITPEMADHMIGNAVMKAADGLRLLERKFVEPELIDRMVGAMIPLPKELRTPQRMARIQAIAEDVRKLENERLRHMVGGRLGERGLTKTIKVGDEEVVWGPDSDFPLPTKGEIALWKEVKKHVAEAKRLRERDIPQEILRQQRKVEESGARIHRAQMEVDRLREQLADVADELENGRPLNAARVSQLLEARTRIQRQILEFEVRSAARRAALVDEIADVERRIKEGQPRKGYKGGREAQRLIEERKRLRAELHDLERNTGSEVERMRRQLDGVERELYEDRPRRQLSTGYRRGKLMERKLNLQKQIVQRERRVQAMERNLTEMRRILLENELPKQLELGRLEGHIQRKIDSLVTSVDDPSVARVPGHWKPLWGAVEDLHRMAADDPILARELEGLPQTFSDLLRFAAEEGFDPTFIPSLTEAEVRHLVYEQVRLGKRGREGMTFEEGGRKQRVGAYARTRSISALAAAFLRTTHEANSNALVDFIETTYARPLATTPDGNLFIPKGWVAWDPERNFILQGERVQGAGYVLAPGMQGYKPQLMIPSGVKRAIQNMTADYNHSVFSWIKKLSNPWRALILTMRPGWYVNNFVGNLIMASVEGVRWQDWVNAWESYRQREQRGGPRIRPQFADVPEAGPAASLLREGAPSVVPNPTGVRGFGIARAEGPRAAYEWVLHRMARANEVVDEIARTAVYHRTRRAYRDYIKAGGSMKVGADELALTRAFEAMVDYGDLSPFERTIVRSAVPFYAWQKGILRLAFRVGFDHPAALGVLMQLGRLNEELQRERYGELLPTAYAGLVPLPGGGNINTRPFNPFADSVNLLTPQGIAASLNPGIEALLRNALGAPEGGFVEDYRIDDYGRAVPDTPLASDITDIFTTTPQATLLTGGYSDRPLPQRVAQFGGASVYSEEDVRKMIERITKARQRAEGA